MRKTFVLGIIALGLASSLARAGELCSALGAQGNFDAASSCYVDETQAAMRRERAEYQRGIDDMIRADQRRTDDAMREIELERRLRRLEDRR